MKTIKLLVIIFVFFISTTSVSAVFTGHSNMDINANMDSFEKDFPKNVLDKKYSIKDHIQHDPIRIDNNTDLNETAQTEGWPGDGSINNPYIIEEYNIDGDEHGYCLYIGNTTDHFVIRNCYLHNASGNYSTWTKESGLNIYNSENGVVENNTISNNYNGISTSECHDNKISNNTVSFNDNQGIYIDPFGDSNDIISGNFVSHNGGYGIYLDRIYWSKLINNTVYDNGDHGIYLARGCRHNTLSGNIISYNNKDGINYLTGRYNRIENNTISNNNNNGLNLWASSQYNIISRNVFDSNGEKGIYIQDGDGNEVIDNSISNNEYGLYVDFNSNVLTGNTISSNEKAGIHIRSSDNTVTKNTLSDNWAGIYLNSSSDSNLVSDNNITSNLYGTYIYSSSGNTLKDNFVYSNSYFGVYIQSSSNNVIYNNDFIENENHAYDDGNNKWNTNYPTGGNYWDGYESPDYCHGAYQNLPGGDDIGDIPYTNIQGDGDAQDNYPYMYSFGEPFVLSTIPISESNDSSVSENVKIIFSESLNTSVQPTLEEMSETGNSYNFKGYSSTNTANDTAVWTHTDWSPEASITLKIYNYSDTVGDQGKDHTWNFTIDADRTKPKLYDITSDKPTTGDSYSLMADITDNVGVNDVFVNYWTDVSEPVNMSIEKVDDHYEYNFSIPTDASILYYEFTAKDSSDNWNSTERKEISVSDNDSPTADAGGDKTINAGEKVTFDGNKSADNIGITEYKWIINGIKRYGESLDYEFTELGVYDVTLTVIDEAGNSDSDTINITVDDHNAPTADAGYDRKVDMGEEVILDGSSSTDDVRIVEYTWIINGETKTGEITTYTFTDVGVYTVILNVTDTSGNYDTDSIVITVSDDTKPVADITGEASIDEDIPALYNAYGSYDDVGIENYTWYIEGIEMYGEEVSHTFENPGEYPIFLTVTDKAGNSDTTSIEIFVKDDTEPTCDAGDDRTISVNESITLDAGSSSDNVGIVEHLWTIDGKTILGEMVTYTFNDTGSYTVILNVTDTSGNHDSDSIVITVKDDTRPIADIDGETSTDEDITSLYNAYGSYDDVGIENYTWYIEAIEMYGEEVSYTFENPGRYILSLTVTDKAGNSDAASIEIDVNDVTKPNCDAGEDRTVSIDDSIKFDAGSSTDNVRIESYVWTIDEKEFYGELLELTFNEIGEHIIRLSVTDPSGNSDTDSIAITVEDTTPPTAVAGDDRTIGIDEQIIFNGHGSTDNGVMENYVWIIEGKEYYGEIITHSFDEPGTYDVHLTVTDSADNSDSDTMTVIVKDDVPPSVSMNVNGEFTVGKEITIDASRSSDNMEIANFEWDFGDGTTSKEMTTGHTYDSSGQYTVTLTIEDESGNTVKDSMDITIQKSDMIDQDKSDKDTGIFFILIPMMILAGVVALVIYSNYHMMKSSDKNVEINKSEKNSELDEK